MSFHDKIQNFIAFFVVPAVVLFFLYVWTVRCGMLPKPDWFRAIQGPSYPIESKP